MNGNHIAQMGLLLGLRKSPKIFLTKATTPCSITRVQTNASLSARCSVPETKRSFTGKDIQNNLKSATPTCSRSTSDSCIVREVSTGNSSAENCRVRREVVKASAGGSGGKNNLEFGGRSRKPMKSRNFDNKENIPPPGCRIPMVKTMKRKKNRALNRL